MVSENNLNIEKEKFLKNLKKSDIQGYIDNLLNQYYNSYLHGDSKKVISIIKEIHDLTIFFESRYPNINDYINYRLVIISTKIFESILNHGTPLYKPKEVELSEKPQNDLFDLFDDELIEKIIMENEMGNIHNFIQFMDSLENNHTSDALPKEFFAEVKTFIRDVKNGKYDYCLSIMI